MTENKSKYATNTDVYKETTDLPGPQNAWIARGIVG